LGGGRTDRLTDEVRTLIDDPLNEPAFSPASLWEIAIKCGLGGRIFR